MSLQNKFDRIKGTILGGEWKGPKWNLKYKKNIGAFHISPRLIHRSKYVALTKLCPKFSYKAQGNSQKPLTS